MQLKNKTKFKKGLEEIKKMDSIFRTKEYLLFFFNINICKPYNLLR